MGKEPEKPIITRIYFQIVKWRRQTPGESVWEWEHADEATRMEREQRGRGWYKKAGTIHNVTIPPVIARLSFVQKFLSRLPGRLPEGEKEQEVLLKES